MLDGGVFLAASQFEAAFVSLAHGGSDLDEAAGVARRAFAQVS
jgi:glutamate-1-semialdehyde aminotransferase